MSENTAFEVGRLYLPIKTIADVLTASQSDLFIRLPGLIAYFPIGIVTPTAGDSVNHAQAFSNLVEQGSCPVNYDGNAYRHLGNGTNYLSAAGYAVSGTEAYIDPSLRGLTLGAWFSIDGLPSVEAGLITKFGAVTNYGYAMTVKSTGQVQSAISSNGSALNVVGGSSVGVGEWNFLVLRFIPSTELAIFVGGVKTTLTTAVAASIFASSQALEVGRHNNDNTQIVHGRVRDAFICQAALPDALISALQSSSAP